MKNVASKAMMIGTTLAYGVVMPSGAVNANDMSFSCEGVLVSALRTTIEVDHGDSFLPDPSPGIVKPSDHATTLKAIGPPLGSMDSPVVATSILCTSQGISLTATITRSADYIGSALQNIVWRPVIELEYRVNGGSVNIETTWRMRLTNGKEIRGAAQAPVPTYPNQTYPINVRATLNRSTGT